MLRGETVIDSDDVKLIHISGTLPRYAAHTLVPLTAALRVWHNEPPGAAPSIGCLLLGNRRWATEALSGVAPSPAAASGSPLFGTPLDLLQGGGDRTLPDRTHDLPTVHSPEHPQIRTELSAVAQQRPRFLLLEREFLDDVGYGVPQQPKRHASGGSNRTASTVEASIQGSFVRCSATAMSFPRSRTLTFSRSGAGVAPGRGL